MDLDQAKNATVKEKSATEATQLRLAELKALARELENDAEDGAAIASDDDKREHAPTEEEEETEEARLKRLMAELDEDDENVGESAETSADKSRDDGSMQLELADGEEAKGNGTTTAGSVPSLQALRAETHAALASAAQHEVGLVAARNEARALLRVARCSAALLEARAAAATGAAAASGAGVATTSKDTIATTSVNDQLLAKEALQVCEAHELACGLPGPADVAADATTAAEASRQHSGGVSGEVEAAPYRHPSIDDNLEGAADSTAADGALQRPNSDVLRSPPPAWLSRLLTWSALRAVGKRRRGRKVGFKTVDFDNSKNFAAAEAACLSRLARDSGCWPHTLGAAAVGAAAAAAAAAAAVGAAAGVNETPALEGETSAADSPGSAEGAVNSSADGDPAEASAAVPSPEFIPGPRWPQPGKDVGNEGPATSSATNASSSSSSSSSSSASAPVGDDPWGLGGYDAALEGGVVVVHVLEWQSWGLFNKGGRWSGLREDLPQPLGALPLPLENDDDGNSSHHAGNEASPSSTSSLKVLPGGGSGAIQSAVELDESFGPSPAKRLGAQRRAQREAKKQAAREAKLLKKQAAAAAAAASSSSPSGSSGGKFQWSEAVSLAGTSGPGSASPNGNLLKSEQVLSASAVASSNSGSSTGAVQARPPPPPKLFGKVRGAGALFTSRDGTRAVSFHPSWATITPPSSAATAPTPSSPGAAVATASSVAAAAASGLLGWAPVAAPPRVAGVHWAWLGDWRPDIETLLDNPPERPAAVAAASSGASGGGGSGAAAGGGANAGGLVNLDDGTTDSEGWMYAPENKDGIALLVGRGGRSNCGEGQGLVGARPSRQLRCRRWSRLCMLARLPPRAPEVLAAATDAALASAADEATASTGAEEEGDDSDDDSDDGVDMLTPTRALAAVAAGESSSGQRSGGIFDKSESTTLSPGIEPLPMPLALEWNRVLDLRYRLAQAALKAAQASNALKSATWHAAQVQADAEAAKSAAIKLQETRSEVATIMRRVQAAEQRETELRSDQKVAAYLDASTTAAAASASAGAAPLPPGSSPGSEKGALPGGGSSVRDRFWSNGSASSVGSEESLNSSSHRHPRDRTASGGSVAQMASGAADAAAAALFAVNTALGRSTRSNSANDDSSTSGSGHGNEGGTSPSSSEQQQVPAPSSNFMGTVWERMRPQAKDSKDTSRQ